MNNTWKLTSIFLFSSLLYVSAPLSAVETAPQGDSPDEDEIAASVEVITPFGSYRKGDRRYDRRYYNPYYYDPYYYRYRRPGASYYYWRGDNDDDDDGQWGRRGHKRWKGSRDDDD